ncbi:hypothetical protein [Wenyingzhuangia sp. IMCC45574]
MDLSNINTEERRKLELDFLSKAEFEKVELASTNEENYFRAELEKNFAGIEIIKLKIKPYNDTLWGSMGMQQFTQKFLNNSNLKAEITEILPFENEYELKNEVRVGGNLFNLLGDLCGIIKQGGCYGSGSDLKNEEILRIVKNFIDQNLKEGYKMYHYIKINEPWAKWFGHNPIYSLTYLLINIYRDEMLMICIVDDD